MSLNWYITKILHFTNRDTIAKIYDYSIKLELE